MPKTTKPELPPLQGELWMSSLFAELGRRSGIARKGNAKAAAASRANGSRPCKPGKTKGRPPGLTGNKAKTSREEFSI